MAYPQDYYENIYYSKIFDTYEEAYDFCNSLPRPAVEQCIKGIVHKTADPQKFKGLEAVAKVLAVAVAAVVLVVLGITVKVKDLAKAILKILKTIFGIVESIAGILKSVLNAIHFHELLAIHKAAYSLAPAYRKLVNKVYSEISNVSERLGFTAEFMNLALRNARAVVLSSSSLIWRPYDMAELEWWSRFDTWSSKANERLTEYKGHPEAVFEDIDEWLIRDAESVGAEKQKGALGTIADTAKKLAETVEDVKSVRDNVGKMIAELPESVQKYVRPVTDQILEKFDNFYYDTYTPTIEALNIEVEASHQRENVLLERLENLDITVKTSTVRIKNWERLPPEERETEEMHQEEISTRPYRRDSVEFEAAVAEEEKRVAELREQRKAITPPTPAPTVLKYEPEKPAAKPAKLYWWTVGDY